MTDNSFSEFSLSAALPRIFKNSNSVLLTSLITMVSTILIYSWVGKVLGPAQFGILSFYIAFSNLFFLLLI